MRILLTGFEPFDGSPTNPSQAVVQRLAACPPAGIDLHTAILPVDHVRGPQELLRALERSRPEAVVCLGEAGGRAAVSLERVAVNLIDDSIPDNAGERWVDCPVVAGGPAAYLITLPVKAMLQAILAAGTPAELSLSAGTFLCNQIAYILLHHLAGQSIPAGFIHLPRLPEQAAAIKLAHPEKGLPATMSLEAQVCGLEAGLQVLLP